MKQFPIINFKLQISNGISHIVNWKLQIRNLKFLRGQTLIELLLAMALAALIIPALVAAFMSTREGAPQQEKRLQAIALLKETEQAVRSVRENNWSTFAVDGTFHTELSGSTWELVSGSQAVNGLTQEIAISSVQRDTNDAIVTSGGITDPSTKKIEITISWMEPFSSTVTSTMYLTRTSNVTYTDSLFNQLNSGITNGVAVATSSGSSTDGQVQLGGSGGVGGDWCTPSFLVTAVDLPKSGVANAIAAIQGASTSSSVVFVGTGENASGVSYATVDLPGNPPVASIPATFDGYKTNAVFGESNYAYLATDNNSKEVTIISLTQFSDPPTNSKYSEVGSINLPGAVNGTSVFVSNDKAYIASSDNKFYIYNLSANRTSSTLQNTGGLTLDGEGKKVLVAGNYAYIATGSTTYPLEIVDITDPVNPSIIGRLALGTGQSGVDVFVNTANASTIRAYLATSVSASQSEFYIVNVSNKASPNISGLGSYDTLGMTPTGVTVVTGGRAIIVGTGGTYQYQVVDILNETSIPTSPCGHLTYATGIRGIASVLQEAGYAYSYVLTGDASSELKVILGGGSYSSTGTFESAVFDPGYSAAYNRFVGTILQPEQTTLKMQVAVAAPVSNSCSNATYSYVGPSGDPAQYFTPLAASISAAIPFGTYGSYQNPQRCFRYKVWFTTSDYTFTPVFYDATLNYSP